MGFFHFTFFPRKRIYFFQFSFFNTKIIFSHILCTTFLPGNFFIFHSFKIEYNEMNRHLLKKSSNEVEL